jgi:predicted acetyltransferase
VDQQSCGGRRSTLTYGRRVSVEIRTITPDEASAYRRAVRSGFLEAATVDDDDFAREMGEPFDRRYVAVDGGEMVATYGSFATELTVPGGVTVPAGAITAVTCRATHRRQGILTRIIATDMADSRDRGEVADVLIAAEYPIYGRFGFGPAVRGTEWELDASRSRFVDEGEGSIQLVDAATYRKEAPAVFDRLRVSRPGMVGRDDLRWDVIADIRRYPESDKPWAGFRALCIDGAGTVQGYARYTVDGEWVHMRPNSTLRVAELAAATPAAEARLWWYLRQLDWVTTIKAADRPADEVLPWLLADGRHARLISSFDMIWLRPLDVGRLLTTRAYDTAGRFVFEVDDPHGLAGGRYVLDAAPDGATCATTTETAELTVPAGTLGAAVLGDARLDLLHRAGWLDEHVAGAAARAAALFAGSVTPWCNTWF